MLSANVSAPNSVLGVPWVGTQAYRPRKTLHSAQRYQASALCAAKAAELLVQIDYQVGADQVACVQADRDGKALEFAQRYQASALCAANAGDLQHDLERREVSPQIAKELHARQGTSTPFYFGVKTILKVRPSTQSQIKQCIGFL